MKRADSKPRFLEIMSLHEFKNISVLVERISPDYPSSHSTIKQYHYTIPTTTKHYSTMINFMIEQKKNSCIERQNRYIFEFKQSHNFQKTIHLFWMIFKWFPKNDTFILNFIIWLLKRNFLIVHTFILFSFLYLFLSVEMI